MAKPMGSSDSTITRYRNHININGLYKETQPKRPPKNFL